MRFLLVVASLLYGGGFIVAPTPSLAEAPSTPELIEQLGHPVYAQRRDARRRLESLGLKAFDDLRAATDHPDPEVAEACDQLLKKTLGTWAWRDDPPKVRRWLDGYGEGMVEDRIACVAGLARLALGEGTPALVRIVRFDASELVSRTAAASLLTTDKFAIDSIREAALVRAVQQMNQKQGVGRRVAARWLDLAADESGEASAEWGGYASDLSQAADTHQAGVNERLIAVLYWRQLRAALLEGNAANAESAIDGLLTLDNEPEGRTLSRAMQWVVDAGDESVADRLTASYADRLEDKRGLYRLAEIAARFGRDDDADRLAGEALAAEATYEGGRAETLYGPQLLVAGDLRRRRHDAWAIAEYEAAIAEADPEADDIDALWAVAQWRLADLYYDAARYAEAAEVLQPLAEWVSKSPTNREQYEKLPQLQYGLNILPGVSGLLSQERLSTALAAREADDRRTEMNALRGALVKDRENADVVIAMYRVKEPTEAFKKQTREALRRMRQIYDRQIWDWEESNPQSDESYTGSPTGLYNQWAWLVSNTEGDFDKAVRYSLRSLEFNPDQASCLDTLGRCFYSAGRVEEAVESQRRAVELQPWMKIMQRQLDEFERALADRTPSGESTE